MAEQSLDDLYGETILDYSQSTARRGELEGADWRCHGINPVCGDEIELAAKQADGRLSRLRYTGHGCAISQASAAMMAEALEGKPEAAAQALAKGFKDFMLGQAPAASLAEELSEAQALEGVRRFPARVKCATLAWNTFLEGSRRKSRGEYEESEP